MQIRNVEPQLEDIYKIENLESISITDLVQNVSGKTFIIPLVIISYDGNKTMSLCSHDKYFDVYIKKVSEVFNDEKDNIYEDSLTDPFGFRRKIQIDEHSKKILESRELLSVRNMYSHYEGLESYDESLLFSNDEVSTLIPIIQYHISRFLEFTDASFTVDSKVRGYHNRYVMNGTLNGLERFFPFLYHKDSDNHYTILVSGILNNARLKVVISYESDGIIVKLSSDGLDLFAEYTYKVLNGVVRRKEDFTLRELTTHYLSEDLNSIDNPYSNISNFDYNAEFTYYKLPWNGVYGIRTNIEDLNNEECKIEIVGSVVECSSESFTRRDAYLLQYKRKDTPTRVGEEITLEEYSSILTGIQLDNNPGYYVIETKFLDTGKPSGYYATHLSDKYYYHLAYSKEPLNKASYQNNITISHESVNQKSDLVNKSLIKQLVGRK